ncbi:MAG: PAS domain S-box protein, partial [bacterium]|nr:PAS domain S-box protein [bacterium]
VDKVKGLEAGGADYITKPLQHEEVLARVNVQVTLRKSQQQLQAQNVLLERLNALLEEQNTRFQRLSEATFEGIVIHDQGRILEANQTLAKMLGYERAELIGMDLLEFVPPAFHEIVLQHIRAGDERSPAPSEIEGYEAEITRKDGSIVPVEVQTKAMPYQGHNVRVTAVRDLALEKEKELLEKENLNLKTTIQDRYKFGEIIGKSHLMQEIYELIAHTAATDANVVILGESGTGKELIARTIHQLSDRQEHALVAINCGAIPDNLFESELFGHRKGAFTGADRDKQGFFDAAHKGTLFLDEVGELSPAMQVKLLRALESGEYIPVGENTPRHADVRVIAATNRNLAEQLRQGVIRQDFFYRINVVTMTLPPLRDRREDIPLLVDRFLKHGDGGKQRTTLPGKIVEALYKYDWPGNIRELQNVLQRYLTVGRLDLTGAGAVESVEQGDIVS